MAPFSQFSGEPVQHAVFRLTLANTGICTFVRKGNESSNPNLSATQSGLQRNRAALLQESLKIAAILQVSPLNRTRESGPSNDTG